MKKKLLELKDGSKASEKIVVYSGKELGVVNRVTEDGKTAYRATHKNSFLMKPYDTLQNAAETLVKYDEYMHRRGVVIKDKPEPKAKSEGTKAKAKGGKAAPKASKSSGKKKAGSPRKRGSAASVQWDGEDQPKAESPEELESHATMEEEMEHYDPTAEEDGGAPEYAEGEEE